MRSIRKQLTLLLISALVLIVFAAAIHGYRSTMAMSANLLDNELRAVVATVASENLASGGQDAATEVVFQIWHQGQLIDRSSNAPTKPIAPLQPGFTDQNFNGSRWRVNAHYFTADDAWVLVAQPLNHRIRLADSMTVSTMLPFLFTVPILAFVVFWSVTVGLKPLKQLSLQLAQRKGNDLTNVKIRSVPTELSPVIETLNSMFSRLQDAFEREQQFAANAAHELRTPLSVLKIKLHNLAQAEPQLHKDLLTLQADTDRMIHVVNQILLLCRTSPELFKATLSKINCLAVAQQVITDLFSKIDQKNQTIELLGEDAFLMSTDFTLYTLLQNLIANASAYAPEAAMIQVSIEQTSDDVTLYVDDSGPGIEPQEREKVLQRFYRDQQDNRYKSQGSGLGLAIVGQIVQLHHASLALATSPLGGLRVAVTFPKGALA